MTDNIILVIRVIRSFPHRNIRNIVLKDIFLGMTTEELLKKALDEVKLSSTLPLPFKKFEYDTLKIEHQAHGSKTSDPVINTENDDLLILGHNLKLCDQNVKNETELSLFKMSDYIEYKESPLKGQSKW